MCSAPDETSSKTEKKEKPGWNVGEGESRNRCGVYCQGKSMARSKKSKAPAATPPNQQTSVGASPVALLIDGENVIAPDLIAPILVEASKMGSVVIRQVYGNWASPSMSPWKSMMIQHALERMGDVPTSAGRNATDIALVIGAMDLLYRGMRHFCLVAGDSDYVPLVLRLRQEGCTVLGIGMPNASHALREACTRFLTTEQLTPQPVLPSPSLSAPPAPTGERSFEELLVLLTTAYHQVAKAGGNEWVLLAVLGKALRDHYPTFQNTYGKKKLSALLDQYPDLFEQRLRTAGQGQTAEVRLREKRG